MSFTRYDKTIVAVIGAGITWAVSNYAGNADVQHWLGLAIALLTAVGVYSQPNKEVK